LDSLINSGLAPVFLGDISPFFAFVNADKTAALSQTPRDADRAVTRKSANFDRGFRADCSD